MDPAYDFEKLAREIVINRLAALGDKAAEAAGEEVRKILVPALKGTKQDPKVTVAAVCRGVMGGLLLLNQDVAKAAAEVLGGLAHVAQEAPVSPEDLMTWAMDGMADVALLAGPEAMHAMESSIEERFMGAGSVFQQACQAKKGAA